MAFKTRMKVDQIRTLAFGAMLGTYKAVGTALTERTRFVALYNQTNEHVYFSIDGVTDQLIVPAHSFKLLDVSFNKIRNDGYFFAKGTIFYVRTFIGPAKSGSVYVEVIHE